MEIINFLDLHNGSLMFLITFVYVIATIFICLANIKSAKATHKQVAEQKRQFDETNRAFITVSFEIIKSGVIALHIKNHGRLIAENVKINISEKFLENVPDTRDREHLIKLTKATFSVGIGQGWHCCIGSHLDLKKLSKELLHIDISYSDHLGKHTESTDIDLGQYSWATIYDSPVEDIHQEIKRQTKFIENISKSI